MISMFRSAAIAATLAFAAPVLAQAPAKAPAKPAAAAPAAMTYKQKVSTMIAMDVARSLDVVKRDLDAGALVRALSLSLNGKPTVLSQEEYQKVRVEFSKDVQARLAARTKPDAPIAPTTMDKVKVSTMVAMDIAQSFEPFKDELDMIAFSRALALSFAGKPTGLTEEQAKAVGAEFGQAMGAKMQARQAKAAEENLAKGKAFLAANKAKPGVRSADSGSGLQYQVLRAGAGARPAATDMVRVHYRGTTIEGKQFDSSYDRGEPAEFALNQVIPGWTEGLQLMTVGSKYRLWIPADKAYGPNGPPEIGPNQTLVFEVELLDIVK
jgi:FKBP-type peptidyl-prolyl cis-trans isomerase FkpA